MDADMNVTWNEHKNTLNQWNHTIMIRGGCLESSDRVEDHGDGNGSVAGPDKTWLAHIEAMIKSDDKGEAY